MTEGRLLTDLDDLPPTAGANRAPDPATVKGEDLLETEAEDREKETTGAEIALVADQRIAEKVIRLDVTEELKKDKVTKREMVRGKLPEDWVRSSEQPWQLTGMDTDADRDLPRLRSGWRMGARRPPGEPERTCAVPASRTCEGSVTRTRLQGTAQFQNLMVWESLSRPTRGCFMRPTRLSGTATGQATIS